MYAHPLFFLLAFCSSVNASFVRIQSITFFVVILENSTTPEIKVRKVFFIIKRMYKLMGHC